MSTAQHSGGDGLAFDRASVRTKDEDGRLHVEITNISKANVCPYKGSEIPQYEALGLDPDRIYQLLRDPEELAKGAPTFNGLPLLLRHVPVSAADHKREITVGSTGTDAAFNAPYLQNSLVVWDQLGIAGIESDEQKELSSAYRYDADMTPGTYEGVSYDGVMRNIRGNHVALVSAGRAGPDVVVGDAAIDPPTIKELPTMAKHATALSRKALYASGAIHAYLLPKLAQDAKIDTRTLVAGVTNANWKTKKPAIVAALTVATKGKLAQDADLEGVLELLNVLDGEVAADDPDDLSLDEEGLSDEEEAQYQALLKRRKAPAMDDPGETPGTPKVEDKDDVKDMVTKPAMDAAIEAVRSSTEKSVVARLNAIREAEKVVRPFIGELAIAQDSAEAVYKLALDAAGVDLDGVPPTAYAAMVKMLPVPGAAPKPRVAMDHAAAKGFSDRYPGAARVKSI